MCRGRGRLGSNVAPRGTGTDGQAAASNPGTARAWLAGCPAGKGRSRRTPAHAFRATGATGAGPAAPVGQRGPTRGRIFHQAGAPFVLDYSRGSGRRRHGCGLVGCANRRGVGLPRKPLPRKKLPADFAVAGAGAHRAMHQGARRVVSQDAVPPAARVSAAGILLDRGWGRAPQPHIGEDDKEVRIIIRDVIAERREG